MLDSETLDLQALTLTSIRQDSILCDQMMLSFSQRAKNLKVLHVTSPVQDEAEVDMMNIALLENLEDFSVRLNYKMTDKVLNAMVTKCKKITRIKLDGKHSKFAKSSSHDSVTYRMSQLLFTGCYSITSLGINAIVNGLKNLQSVTLWYLDIAWITTGFPVNSSIQNLEIEGCRSISAKDMKKVSSFQKLEELTFRKQATLTDDVIHEISSRCEQLKKITIEGELTRDERSCTTREVEE